MANKIVCLWPSHAEQTHQELSLKWRNNEKREEEKRREKEGSEQGNKEVGGEIPGSFTDLIS